MVDINEVRATQELAHAKEGQFILLVRYFKDRWCMDPRSAETIAALIILGEIAITISILSNFPR